jgi:hypothetical protein
MEHPVEGQEEPAYSVAGLAINGVQVLACTAEETRLASARNSQTFELLPPDPMTSFVAMEEICPAFMRAINQETPVGGNLGIG